MRHSIFILFILFLVGCEQSTKNSLGIPFKPFSHNYPHWNNPINYVRWNENSVYILRDPIGDSPEIIIEIPLNKTQAEKGFIRDVRYYQFDIQAYNGEYGRRKFLMKKNDGESPVRNVKISLFDFDLTKVPDFKMLESIDSLEYQKVVKSSISSGKWNYYFLISGESKLFWIKKSDGLNAHEKEILNWLKQLKSISAYDAIFYDQFVSDSIILDKSSYFSKTSYIIE